MEFSLSIAGRKSQFHGLPARKRCIFLYSEGLYLFSFAINVKRTLSIKMHLCPSTEEKKNLLVTTDLVCEDELELAWIYFKGHSCILKTPILKHCCMFFKLMFSAS